MKISLTIKKIPLGLAVYVICFSLSAQSKVSGKVLDKSGNPIPYATVYLEGTTNGTTSNSEGLYQLSVPNDLLTIAAQHVGYKKTTREVRVDKDISLDFYLSTEPLVLREVVISGNEDNPAYAIIRKTIDKRKYHQKEVNAFACEAYIKGLQRLDQRPTSLLGRSIDLDTGIVYLSESISELKFLRPDQINETIISSKMSGDNNVFSYNQASELLFNLYDNTFYVDGLSERKFISPIASNAFLHYDYQLAGSILQDSLVINKIRVIPKRETDPVFSGHLYIIEDSWRLHSVDVMLTRANGINFVDTLRFNQVFAPVAHGIWMPISQRLRFNFKVFGFKGSGHFTAVYRNYEIEPNYNLLRENETHKTTTDNEDKPLLDKKDFSKAVITVKEDANKKDSAYWKEVRPIPLSSLEIADYKRKDSIQLIKESKPYLDSMDQRKNKFRPANLLITGYRHYNSYKKRYLEFPTLIETVQYNAVEGLAVKLEMRITQRDDIGTTYQITPNIRYGFANRAFQAKIEGYTILNRKKHEILSAGIGRFISQINDNNPIPFFLNSAYSLILGENYARFYQKSFIYTGYQREIANGLLLTGRLTYDQREQMVNHASFNFSNGDFDPNVPVNDEVASDEASKVDFPKHEALSLALRFKYTFGQRYIDRPDRKINLKSKFPDLYLVFRKGIPVMGSEIDYDFLKLGVDYELIIGLLGTSRISLWAGDYLTKEQLYFQDFEHFNGNQTIFRQNGENLFSLLEYYRFSTQSQFIEGHYEHHFNEFIFNKVPYIKRLNLQAVASVNYLATHALGHYFEFGVGIEHIFNFLRVDFYSSIRDGDYERSGIRIGTGF